MKFDRNGTSLSHPWVEKGGPFTRGEGTGISRPFHEPSNHGREGRLPGQKKKGASANKEGKLIKVDQKDVLDRPSLPADFDLSFEQDLPSRLIGPAGHEPDRGTVNGRFNPVGGFCPGGQNPDPGKGQVPGECLPLSVSWPISGNGPAVAPFCRMGFEGSAKKKGRERKRSLPASPSGLKETKLAVVHGCHPAGQGHEKGGLTSPCQKECQAWELPEFFRLLPGGPEGNGREGFPQGGGQGMPGSGSFPKDEKSRNGVRAGEILLCPAKGA